MFFKLYVLKKGFFKVICFTCVIFLVFSGASLAKPNQHDKMPITVETTIANFGEVSNSIEAVGTLRSALDVTILSEVSGKITGVYFFSGEKVKKGQILLTVDDTIPKNNLATAKSKLVFSKENYVKALQLVKDGIFSEIEIIQIKSNYEADLANYNNAKKLLNLTVIKAPFDGTLDKRNLNYGDYLSVGAQIVRIFNDKIMRVDFEVPQKYASYLRNIKKIYISREKESFENIKNPSDSFHKPINAMLYFIDKIVNPETRTVSARAQVSNSDNNLMIGEFVSVNVPISAKKSIKIADTAIAKDDNGIYVYLVKNNIATKQYIGITDCNDGYCSVNNGIQKGDEVVTIGSFKLSSGDFVYVNNIKK